MHGQRERVETRNLEDGNKLKHLINFEWIVNTQEINKISPLGDYEMFSLGND